MEKNSYKIIGIVNYFDVIPSSVFTVLEGEDGNYYLGFWNADNKDPDHCYIASIEPLYDNLYDKIIYLKDLNVQAESLQESYCIGDIVPVAIQTSDTDVYIGRLDKYLAFLIDYQTKCSDQSKTCQEWIADEIAHTKLLVNEMNNRKN